MKTISYAARVAAPVAALVLSTSAQANDFGPAMEAYLETEVRAWAQDPVVVEAIMAQNARMGGLPQSEIDALDAAWRAEVGAVSSPTIAPVLEGPAAEFLRTQVANSGGMITEIFAVDAQGLNVAASAVTSDYWQGDEAKFTQTFPMGAGGVHLGEVEFDESSQSFQGQISLTIVDPATGEPIGAMTIGINAEALL